MTNEEKQIKSIDKPPKSTRIDRRKIKSNTATNDNARIFWDTHPKIK
jgi:hypothetical protein